MSEYKIKGLAFQGGGTLGISHVGAIQVFEEKGILDNIKYFVGTSSGAIVATMLSCNADVKRLKEILCEKDFKELQDDSYGVIRDINRFISSYGWYKGDKLEEWYEEALKEFTGDGDITFKQAYEKYGKHLTITTTNMNIGKTVYLSHETSPDMMLRTAIRRSSLIPFVFKADKEQIKSTVFEDNEIKEKIVENYFADGGMLHNYPIQVLDKYLEFDEVVGLKLLSTEDLQKIKIPEIASHSTENIIDYIMSFINIIQNQALKLHVEEKDWKRTVKIDVRNISSTDFNLSEEDKKFLLKQGKDAAENFLKLRESSMNIN
tara:strand:- start:8550 stop:9506 length:957 start_codon:yes stop_codon:yes gene_type:complete